MRYPRCHRETTRARIVQEAARQFRARGFVATGIDAVMGAAGLTSGGFYAHFASKESLFKETIEASFAVAEESWVNWLKGVEGAEWVQQFVRRYLSEQHRDAPSQGCPMPSLAPEVSRAGKAPRDVFEKHVCSLVGLLESKLGRRSRTNREHVIALVALCVGGIALARAVRNGALSDSILEACRGVAARLLSKIERG